MSRRSTLPRAAVALVLLAGCRSSPRAGSTEGDARAPAPGRDAQVTPGGAGVDAGSPLVDLLRSVPAIVAVSSKVANPRDFPEHLVDGKPETAWNSATGDLRGFIAFRVSNVCRVKRIELTAGFDKMGPSGDLFTQNHRITRVRLSRDGVLVRTAHLDPEVRALQGFDLDEPGGDFKLEIEATLPGSTTTWRELTVSEFRVLGLPNGAPRNPDHIPTMTIGSLDGIQPHVEFPGSPPRGPFPSVAALCAAYSRAMTPRIDAAFPEDRYPGPIHGPHCEVEHGSFEGTVRTAVARGPFRSGLFVAVHDVSNRSRQLVLETAQGFSLSSVVLSARGLRDPGCAHASEERFEDARLLVDGLGREVLVVRLLARDQYWMDARPEDSGTVESAYACRVDERGAAACQGPLRTGSSPETSWNAQTSSFDRPLEVGAVRWTARAEPLLGPAGDLRLGH